MHDRNQASCLNLGLAVGPLRNPIKEGKTIFMTEAGFHRLTTCVQLEEEIALLSGAPMLKMYMCVCTYVFSYRPTYVINDKFKQSHV